VNDTTSKATLPSITARPSLEEKRLFSELAATRQMSESALALCAIRVLLHSELPGLPRRNLPTGPAVDRITIRLRPGDRLPIQRRASERRMKDSAYIAALVRGHVGANPPLTTHELAAFKTAVSLLARFGRLLAQTTREASQAGVLPSDLRQYLGHTRTLIADLERRTHEFVRTALVAWEGRIG
jgi:hypothetical protein